MTAGTWAWIAAIVGATILTTWRFRHVRVTMTMVAPLYGFLVAGAIVYFALSTAAQADINHQMCVARHEDRDDDRAVWFALTDRLADRGLPEDAAYLKAQIDILKPDISKEPCP